MAKKATILIVDKEKILVDLLTRSLSSKEVSVFGTTSAEEAAKLVELHAPDLAVIDPTIQNGLALINSLSSSFTRTKILAVTSSDEVRGRVNALGIERVVDRDRGLDGLVAAIQQSIDTNLPLPRGAESVRLLIADDEEEICSVLSEYLPGRGYAIVFARNGRDAVDAIADDPTIQVVLLDVSMPVMGGIEALSRIMARHPHPSVIMMTAVADREVARQALQMGAFDYVLKPFDFASIEASIVACLSHLEYQNQPWWKRLMRR